MLKKFVAVLSLLLACVLCISSCTIVDVIDHGTTESTTNNDPETKTPYSIVGIWHSKESKIVLNVMQGGAVQVYSLTAGYYEYDSLETGSYILNGSKFTLVLGTETYDFEFDDDIGLLTLGEMSYKPAETVPTKHPVYDFPNFAEMDLSGIVSIGEMDLTTLKQTALEGAAMEIFSQYYSSGLETPDTITDRPAKHGDYVNIDYEGKLNGVAFAGGTADEVDLHISDYNNSYIPGFVDGIVGHEVGTTFDVEVTFPENYGEASLAGQKTIFTMTLNTIYKQELTQEQFEIFENTGYNSYSEWVIGTAKKLALDLSESTLEDACQMIGDMNKEHYQYFYQYTLDYWHRMAAAYGMEYEEMLTAVRVTEEMMLLEAQSTALYYMTNYQLAKQENLTWTQKQFDDAYESYVQSYLDSNTDAPREDAEAYADVQLPIIYLNLTMQVVSEWIVEQAFASN